MSESSLFPELKIFNDRSRADRHFCHLGKSNNATSHLERVKQNPSLASMLKRDESLWREETAPLLRKPMMLAIRVTRTMPPPQLFPDFANNRAGHSCRTRAFFCKYSYSTLQFCKFFKYN